MSNLLISEPPLVVLPTLANAIGLNEAIVLQQIHFWIGQSVNEYDGHKWTYRTDQQWLDVFSFWSESTLRRAVTKLKKLGLIRVEKLSRYFGGNSFDQKNYYTVIYSVVDELPLNPSDCASSQNDQMEVVKTNTPSSQNDQIRTSQNDQIRTSQNDQIRTSQNDQMFKENKQDYYRDGDDAPATPTETSLFEVDLKPASALSTRNAFPMHFEWEPSGSFFDRCKVQGVRFDLFSSDEQEQILGEFRSYWEGRGTEENQGSWEHKLCSQVKRKLIEKTSLSPAPTKQDKRASVTASIMDITDTSWAD